jgi:hypothetical protein
MSGGISLFYQEVPSPLKAAGGIVGSMTTGSVGSGKDRRGLFFGQVSSTCLWEKDLALTNAIFWSPLA